MGLIVNKPAPEVSLKDVLSQLELAPEGKIAKEPVHFGGPVEMARGFVLHSEDYESRLQTLAIGDHFGMSATVDILEDIAKGTGPKSAILALGYSGWGPGQLESEILQNGWLTCDADPELVFGEDDDGKWEAALKTLGVDPLTLSATAGHA